MCFLPRSYRSLTIFWLPEQMLLLWYNPACRIIGFRTVGMLPTFWVECYIFYVQPALFYIKVSVFSFASNERVYFNIALLKTRNKAILHYVKIVIPHIWTIIHLSQYMFILRHLRYKNIALLLHFPFHYCDFRKQIWLNKVNNLLCLTKVLWSL